MVFSPINYYVSVNYTDSHPCILSGWSRGLHWWSCRQHCWSEGLYRGCKGALAKDANHLSGRRKPLRAEDINHPRRKMHTTSRGRCKPTKIFKFPNSVFKNQIIQKGCWMFLSIFKVTWCIQIHK